ncbi:hypothetical protein BBO99_00005293 [Phytophthora kernoviae]|uniref:Uncharacterized protein n=2 Tax=Phytophthora kernoviae TaxID=325452 RepID=A0A421F6J9_9STRA|nr:hypothetical protein G195_007224 [Phytophthora kernoviae 00238/432]KAG2521753.1 hypothetical protein JM16_005665 [Phytophthora kernoviae]KAG2523118.1 hypothetical protein JM18_005534 [Phytophthora kernoviae]RLN26523.1 hypothetical protein BBI17_005962 [Phytophthora kernoviae]RLN79394.1 hypothetical protein BBO99_00005293 [Phytophthora kernoviae]
MTDPNDTNMTDATMQEETDIEVITADETTQEFEIGEAPQDDDDAMEGEDEDGKISAEDADVRDDAAMVFSKHSGPVYSIKVNPVDPRIVMTGGGDDVAVIWNREDGNVLHTLTGHQDSVVGVDFSFDGNYAATGGYDGVVKIWEVATGKLVQNLEGPSQEVEWVCWHKKGNVVLAGSGDGTMIVTGSSDTTVRVWNPKTGECNHVFRGHGSHEGPITFISCHPTQPLTISGSQDGTARLLQVQTKRVLATLSHDADPILAGTVNETATTTENSVECGGFCNTMNWAATGCLGGFLRIWDLATYQCRHICRHPAGVIKLLWHPTQPIVYSCTVEGLIYVWDARTGQLLKTLAGHTDMVLDMTFIPAFENNPVAGLLTVGDDESVRFFHVDN